MVGREDVEKKEHQEKEEIPAFLVSLERKAGQVTLERRGTQASKDIKVVAVELVREENGERKESRECEV